MIGMSESALDRRERLLSTYNKTRKPVSDWERINNENSYTVRRGYHYK